MAQGDIRTLPSASAGLTISSPASAWGYSSYSTLDTGKDYAMNILGITIMPNMVNPANDTTHELVLELYYGTSDTLFAQIPVTWRIDTKVNHTLPKVYNLPEPYSLPANMQIRARIADSSSSAWTHNGIKIFIEEGATQGAEFELALSSNFTDGASTTAQLTAPAGKTTSDFSAGKISETSNPATSINIPTLDYTELEWNFIATDDATDSEVYEFRITVDGTAITDYTVTPEWTVGNTATRRIFNIS